MTVTHALALPGTDHRLACRAPRIPHQLARSVVLFGYTPNHGPEADTPQ
jgi:hypothetical protein